MKSVKDIFKKYVKGLIFILVSITEHAFIVCTPPPPFLLGWRGGRGGGGLTGALRRGVAGIAGKEGGKFCQGRRLQFSQTK